MAASAANSQSIYDKCIAAIEAQDASKLKEIATTVKRLKYPGINAKKAEQCLEEAFGKDFEFDPATGSFVDGEEAAERKKQKAANRERQTKIAEISNRLGCHRKKLENIDRLRAAQIRVFYDNNASLIELRTYAACVELNSADPSSAILNPICREVFQNTLHPDLELDNDFLDKLDVAEKANREASDKLQAELSKLQMDSSLKKSNSDFRELIEDALTPCG